MTTKEIGELRDRVTHLEKILILGEGDHLPLAEIVRNLTNTVSDYIAQKDKEEQKRKEQEEQAVIYKRAEWNKLKWLIIPSLIGGGGVIISQALVFYFRIMPVLEKLSQ